MILKILFTILFISSSLLAEYQTVKPNYKFEFPKDHGVHADYPMEWWYFTGHLNSKNSKTFGFEVTVFRIGVDDFKESASPWKARNLFLIHTALTDDQEQKFYHQEEFIRESFDLIEASTETLKIKTSKHQIIFEDNKLKLKVALPNYKLSLNLTPKKPVILHGEGGYSKKSPENGSASLYMSYTNLQGNGELILNNDTNPVEAKAWMDHEVMGKVVSRDTSGWDWFAIQLDNNQELMLYYLKDQNGNITNFSKGSFVDHKGNLTNLELEDFKIQVLDYWKSPKTKISYPAKWQISVPRLNLDLTVKPTLNNQEFTGNDLSMTYWEGRSLVYQESQVTGQAYVELVGYKN